MLVDEDDEDDDDDDSSAALLLIDVDNLVGFLSKSFKEIPINPLTAVSMDEITDMWDFEFGIKDNQYWVTPWDFCLFLEKLDKLRCERLEAA